MSVKLTKLSFQVNFPVQFEDAIDKQFESEVFTIVSPKSKQETCWNLCYNFKDQGESNVFIGLRCLTNDIDFDVFVVFSVENFQETPGNCVEAKQIVMTKNMLNNKMKLGHSIPFEHLHNNKASYFPNGMLNFKVNILCQSQDQLESHHDPSEMTNVLESIYESREQCDVFILTADELLSAHSLILSKRSEVFDEAFKKNKTFYAREFPSKIMDIILKFIYTNRLIEFHAFNENEIIELYKAAKKCGILAKLIKANAGKMHEQLTNPIKLVGLFEECGLLSDELLNSSALIINDNPKTMEQEDWKNLKNDIKMKILQISVQQHSLTTKKLGTIETSEEVVVVEDSPARKKACFHGKWTYLLENPDQSTIETRLGSKSEPKSPQSNQTSQKSSQDV